MGPDIAKERFDFTRSESYAKPIKRKACQAERGSGDGTFTLWRANDMAFRVPDIPEGVAC